MCGAYWSTTCVLVCEVEWTNRTAVMLGLWGGRYVPISTKQKNTTNEMSKWWCGRTIQLWSRMVSGGLRRRMSHVMIGSDHSVFWVVVVGTIVLIDYATTRNIESWPNDEYWLESTVSSLYWIVLLFISNGNSRGWRKYSSYFRYLTLVILNSTECKLIHSNRFLGFTRILYTLWHYDKYRFDPSYGIHNLLLFMFDY